MSKIPLTLCPDFTLKGCDTDQNMFCNFCYQTRNGGPHVSLFSIGALPVKRCSKIEGHHSIKMPSFKFL